MGFGRSSSVRGRFEIGHQTGAGSVRGADFRVQAFDGGGMQDQGRLESRGDRSIIGRIGRGDGLRADGGFYRSLQGQARFRKRLQGSIGRAGRLGLGFGRDAQGVGGLGMGAPTEAQVDAVAEALIAANMGG
jgi:hypothetical protein